MIPGPDSIIILLFTIQKSHGIISIGPRTMAKIRLVVDKFSSHSVLTQNVIKIRFSLNGGILKRA